MKTASEKMIIVDLTKGKIKVLPLRTDLEQGYMGGEGTGTRLVWEMVPAGIHPLEPKNTLVFATAPLNGTIFPAGPRGTIVFKSPETGSMTTSLLVLIGLMVISLFLAVRLKEAATLLTDLGGD